MRILHCCLAAFYIDNYSYQENVLPRMHKLQGHEVAILASTETYIKNATLGYVSPGSYCTPDRIAITRIPYISWLPHLLSKKLRIYKGISKVVEQFKPDIIFLHDCQFVGIKEIISYVRKNPHVKVYVDGHTDFINSAKNWVSKNILHRLVYRWCAQSIEPYTRKFYGVLPLRSDFFRDVYGIPPEKIELLVLGAEQNLVDLSKREEIRTTLRSNLGLSNNDFVIVTGGKLDERKKIHCLMKAVDELQNDNISLIVFGSPNSEMKYEIEELAKSTSIKYVGWSAPEKTYEYLLSADLVLFPGTHSVLWEQAVGLGLPCVFKKWEGMQHLDLGGNCLFINSANLPEIKESIMFLYNDRNFLGSMRKVAEEKGMKEFSYYEIAKRAIEA